MYIWKIRSPAVPNHCGTSLSSHTATEHVLQCIQTFKFGALALVDSLRRKNLTHLCNGFLPTPTWLSYWQQLDAERERVDVAPRTNEVAHYYSNGINMVAKTTGRLIRGAAGSAVRRRACSVTQLSTFPPKSPRFCKQFLLQSHLIKSLNHLEKY